MDSKPLTMIRLRFSGLSFYCQPRVVRIKTSKKREIGEKEKKKGEGNNKKWSAKKREEKRKKKKERNERKRQRKQSDFPELSWSEPYSNVARMRGARTKEGMTPTSVGARHTRAP